jgi:hypothetical protein
MGTSTNPEIGRPDYLDWPEFVELRHQLEAAGFYLGRTPTHLLAGDLRIAHAQCRANPKAVVAQILVDCRAELRTEPPRLLSSQGRSFSSSGNGAWGEFTSGGQHISERSG